MNIIQYDDTFSSDDLWSLAKTIHETFPDFECLYIPKSITVMENVGAEDLFAIADKIAIALDNIKIERPEEYEKAYNNRMVIHRDEQWRKVIKKAEEIRKK